MEAAFDYFLEHYSHGRPFILAGHSQGSRHLEVLLVERISGTELLERMVAAYPIGYGIHQSQFAAKAPDIPVCSEPGQLHCWITWSSVGPKVAMPIDTSANACVNPLTWKTDGSHAPHELNPGGLSVGEGARVEIAVADAQCTEDGVLLVSEIRASLFEDTPIYMGRDNHHVLDYALYYVSLRRNATERAQKFLQLSSKSMMSSESGD